MQTKIIAFLRENPVPLFGIIGLLAGAILRFGFALPEIADWVWLAVLVIGGAPTVLATVRKMLKGNFAADVVAMLAIITAVIMHEYFAGVIIVIMQSGGEALENYSLRRASSTLEQLLARAPRTAHRKADGQITEIAASDVRVKDILIVRPGDLIAVDGLLLSAQAAVDESALTGEPLTRNKQAGEVLLSGSINGGDAFDMEVSKIAAESTYAQIVQLVEKAQQEKPPLQRLADRYAVWFTPVTLVMCAIGWWITGTPSTILAVLVVATPCPLILAVPVAVLGGINRAASASIVVKGGTAIEQIGHVDVMVFDKTGTLTFGTPKIDEVVALNGMSQDDLLRIAGSVEQLSSHTLGQTLTAAAQSQGLTLPTNFQEHSGFGVEGDLDGQHIVLGSPRYLNDKIGKAVPDEMLRSTLATYIAIDNQLAGVITFKDELRPGVPELMQQLRALGVKRTVMLTGDSDAHAQAIGKAAGIDQIEANLLPEDKVRLVKALMEQHKVVAMVGDGINDAPALATATVGVAMGAHGTGISAEAADIVLLVDDVTKIAYAVEAEQRMLRIAKQSIYIGLGVSFAFMVIASFGLISPSIGALLQEVVDVLVILNALRAR
ncbi:MAG: heavy metal translocating P-type ATPase [Phototrophicaceae bacterium]|jgi:heavy metal translocating P-type ATPase